MLKKLNFGKPKKTTPSTSFVKLTRDDPRHLAWSTQYFFGDFDISNIDVVFISRSTGHVNAAIAALLAVGSQLIEVLAAKGEADAVDALLAYCLAEAGALGRAVAVPETVRSLPPAVLRRRGFVASGTKQGARLLVWVPRGENRPSAQSSTETE